MNQSAAANDRQLILPSVGTSPYKTSFHFPECSSQDRGKVGLVCEPVRFATECYSCQSSLCWSTGFVIARLAMPYVEPATFLFWRFAGVISAMAALSLVWRITWPSWSQMKHIAVAGLLLQFGYLLGVWFAVHLGMTAGGRKLIHQNTGSNAGFTGIAIRAIGIQTTTTKARI